MGAKGRPHRRYRWDLRIKREAVCVRSTIGEELAPYDGTTIHRRTLVAESKLSDLLSCPTQLRKEGATVLQNILAEMGLETGATNSAERWDENALSAFNGMYDTLTKGWIEWTHAVQDANEAKKGFADCLKDRREI